MGKAPDVKLRKRFVFLLFMSKGEKTVEERVQLIVMVGGAGM